MNNTFDLKRFTLLVKKQWLEFGKIYLITLGIVAGIIIGFYSYSCWLVFNKPYVQEIMRFRFRMPLFIITGMLFLTISANNHFAHLGQKARAISELTLPASTLEKFLTGLFYSVLLAIAAYILLFYLIDLAFVSKMRDAVHTTYTETSFKEGIGDVTITKVAPEYFYKLTTPPVRFMYVIPFLLSSIFLLGSICFTRFHYIKTTICFMVFLAAWLVFMYRIASSFAGKAPVNQIQIKAVGHFIEWGITGCLILTSFALWAITYLRLREKEV